MKISSAKKNKLYGIITIVIEKDDYEHKVSSVLKKYSKTASIPGFRKGFVPLSLIKKQYGSAVKVDEINKLVDSSLKKFINDAEIKYNLAIKSLMYKPGVSFFELFQKSCRFELNTKF